jgi:hypothetical protein
MSVTIPKNVITDLRDRIYQRLDAVQYLSQDRTENGKVMDSLVSDPFIGGRIAEYVGRAKVKTYIKDAVINRYAKERTRPPEDLSVVVNLAFSDKYTPLTLSRRRGVAQVYKSESGYVTVVSCGTLLKWETALRKLLEYLGRHGDKFAALSAHPPQMLLVLMSGGKVITCADRALLERALAQVGVHARIL